MDLVRLAASTVRLPLSDHSQLSDDTFRLQLFKMISENKAVSAPITIEEIAMVVIRWEILSLNQNLGVAAIVSVFIVPPKPCVFSALGKDKMQIMIFKTFSHIQPQSQILEAKTSPTSSLLFTIIRNTLLNLEQAYSSQVIKHTEGSWNCFISYVFHCSATNCRLRVYGVVVIAYYERYTN